MSIEQHNKLIADFDPLMEPDESDSTPSPSLQERAEREYPTPHPFSHYNTIEVKKEMNRNLLEKRAAYIKGAQDEAAIRGASEQQKGMQWVKATERQPADSKTNKIFAKVYVNSHIICRVFFFYDGRWNDVYSDDCYRIGFVREIEWLDESTPPTGLSREAVLKVIDEEILDCGNTDLGRSVKKGFLYLRDRIASLTAQGAEPVDVKGVADRITVQLYESGLLKLDVPLKKVKALIHQHLQ